MIQIPDHGRARHVPNLLLDTNDGTGPIFNVQLHTLKEGQL